MSDLVKPWDNMLWDSMLWGVTFSSQKTSPILIGRTWGGHFGEHYAGEPTRPLLFNTRREAQAWCKEKNGNGCIRFRAVRVREVVSHVIYPSSRASRKQRAIKCP